MDVASMSSYHFVVSCSCGYGKPGEPEKKPWNKDKNWRKHYNHKMQVPQPLKHPGSPLIKRTDHIQCYNHLNDLWVELGF